MFEPGQTIAGKYAVERVIGQGGMGTVVAARHLLLGERVAIKVLLATDANARARLLREARAAARLKSDHVVRVLDVVELDDGRTAIVLEHVEGGTLADELARHGPLPLEEAARYALEAAHGVGEAHARGIVHRDLKPSNLVLATLPDGRRRVRVIDFGVAQLDDAGAGAAVTRSDALLGSPAYMSPEQIRDPRDVDPRSDVWSLGVVLYELLSGALPFESYTTSGLLARIVAEDPVPLDERRPELPADVVATVHACLSRAPHDRPASMAELAERLAPHATDGAALARSVRAVLTAPPDAPGELQPAPATTPASHTSTLEPETQATQAPTSSVVSQPAPTSRSRLLVPLAIAAVAAAGWFAWPTRAPTTAPTELVAPARPRESAPEAPATPTPTGGETSAVATSSAERPTDRRPTPRVGAPREAAPSASAPATPAVPSAAATRDPLDALGPRK